MEKTHDGCSGTPGRRYWSWNEQIPRCTVKASECQEEKLVLHRVQRELLVELERG